MSKALTDLQRLQQDPVAFRDALLIDTDLGSRPFRDCMDEWQRADFAALDSGWVRCAMGAKSDAKYQRGWLERPRGHSKSLDLGVMALWALFASRRRLSGIGAAGDQDQARLLRDAISKLVYCNPWLSSFIEVQSYRVINTKTESSLEIISSDAKTAYGLTPDFLILDEVTHWAKRDLWDSLISSAAKRASCMVVVISNAGLQDDWQWTAREAVRNDPTWFFSRLDGPVASWISPAMLEEQRRLLPPIAFERLWQNAWTSGGGDALSLEAIAAAFKPELRSHDRATADFAYVAGLDLGVSRDSSAVCTLAVRTGRHDFGRIVLAAHKTWKPTKGTKVNLTDVENYLVELNARFRLATLSFDPWQATHLAQRLSSTGLTIPERLLPATHKQTIQPKSTVKMVEVPPVGNNLQRMASVLIETFNDARIHCYDCDELRRDLTKLRVEERSYGFRLVSPRDETGHGDLASAFSLALLGASELAGRRPVHEIQIVADGAVSSGMTRMQAALAQLDHLRFCDRVDEELARRESHNDPFKKFLQRVGRL